MNLVVEGIGGSASNVLDHINYILVKVNVVLLVLIHTCHTSHNQLIRAVIRQAHVAFHLHDDQISSCIVHGNLAETLEIVSSLR